MYRTVLEMEAGHSCVFSVFACVVLKDAIGFGTDHQWTDLLVVKHSGTGVSSCGSGASFAAFANVALSSGFTQFTGLLDVKRDTKDFSYFDIPSVGIADPKLFFFLVLILFFLGDRDGSRYYRAFPFLFVKKQTKYNNGNSVIQKYGHNGSKGFLTLNTPRASGFTAPPSPLS